jgi:hypothetical protein
MGLIVTPNRFTSQPQYPAPLDSGIYRPDAAWLGSQPNVYANSKDHGNSADVVFYKPGVAVGGKSWYLDGSQLSTTSSFSASSQIANALNGATQATIAFVMTPTAVPTGTTEARLIDRWDATLSFLLEFYGPQIGFALSDSTGAITARYANYTVTAGQLLSVVLLFDATQAIGNQYQYFINGIGPIPSTSWYTAGAAIVAINSVADPLAIGCQNNNVTTNVASSVHLHALSLTAHNIGASAARQLSDDYWRMYQAPPRRIWVASSSGAVALASNATATTTGTATASVAVAIASAALSTATGSGTASVAIALSGAGTATATDSGTLNLSVALNSAALATALGSATIQQAIAIGSNATASAIGSGTVSLAIALNSAALANAAGTGTLASNGALSANAVASVLGSGTLNQAITIQGASLAGTSGSGNLTQIVPITASSAVAATGSGTVQLSISMSAAALATALATGNLTLKIAMSAASVANVIATGNLVNAGLILLPNARFMSAGIVSANRMSTGPRVSRISTGL